MRAVADLGLGQLMAGVAIAAVGPARRIVGEAQAVARLRDPLALLPVADELAVGRIFDRGLLALLDRLGHGLRRQVVVRRALLHRLVLHRGAAASRPARSGTRRLDRGIDPGGDRPLALLRAATARGERAATAKARAKLFCMAALPLSASGRERRSRRPRPSWSDRRSAPRSTSDPISSSGIRICQ